MNTILLILAGFILGRIKYNRIMRDGKLYLIRITLIKTKWFSLKIHKAVMSDPAVPHDHPWNYWSLILWGGYFEEKTLPSPVHNLPWRAISWYGPGRLLYRRGNKLHRLIIPDGKYSISLILTTKKWRDWGFYDTVKGWISHKEGTYT